MADHPLRSATHRCLGGPLPHQLANGTRTHPLAEAFTEEASFPPPYNWWSLSGISCRFQQLSRTRGQIIHALLTRAPLYSGAEAPFRVRLACVKHAASVQSEPESNSPVQICIYALRIKSQRFLPSLRYSLVNEQSRLMPPALFAGTFYARLYALCQETFLKKLLRPFRFSSRVSYLTSFPRLVKKFFRKSLKKTLNCVRAVYISFHRRHVKPNLQIFFNLAF